MRTSRALLSLALVTGGVAGSPACVTDHGALEKPDDRGRGGRAGSGGAAGAGAGGSAGAPVAGMDSGGLGGRPPDEPPGDDVLTIVNGIVDAAQVRLCFRASSAGDERFVSGPPEAAVFGYARALTIRELDGVDFELDSLEPVVIAGELELVAELDCEAAVARASDEQAAADPGELGTAGAGGAAEPPPPPRLRTGALPILPAGTLTRGRSTLYAASGCIGGPAFVADNDQLACGTEYSGRSPTLGAVWVNLSRRSRIGKLGLQVVQASVATEDVSIQSKRITASSEPAIAIQSFVAYGTVAPRVAHVEASSDDYGANTQLFMIEARGDLASSSTETWQAVRARAGIERVEDGQTYAIVVVGPSIGLAEEGFWNPPAFVLVPTDPTRADAQ